MYFFLILFFISLVSIAFMVGRKLKLLNTDSTVLVEEIVIEAIDLEKVKHKTVKHAKRYGFLILVTTLRISIKTSHLFKKGIQKLKIKVIYVIEKISKKKEGIKEREVSGFLKMVSEYKGKIKEITDNIKEEEGIK